MYSGLDFSYYIVYEECQIMGGGLHRGSILATHPAAPGLILGILKNFSLDVAEIY